MEKKFFVIKFKDKVIACGAIYRAPFSDNNSQCNFLNYLDLTIKK